MQVKPIRILLVDDHPMVRDGLRLRLSAVPHFEVVAEAGERDGALRCLREGSPEVVIQDVGLKGASGLDLIEEMLAIEAELKVLVFSMYDNAEYVQRALQAGARGYVLKDAPAAEIVAAIDAVAAGGVYLSPTVSRHLFQAHAPRTLLSPRETEILAALGRGESSKQIARDLSLSVRTVEAHRQSIKRKLGLEGQAELIKYAVEHAGDVRREARGADTP